MKTEAALIQDFFGDMISSYSRADAIADGVLIPVSPELCSEAGIILPFCVTNTVWGIIDPHNLANLPGQSIEGRLWDLLWMFRCAVKSGNGSGDRIRYSVLFSMNPGRAPVEMEFIAVCGPGDSGEPIITIMVPGED